MKKIILILSLIFSLQGCIFVAGAAAGAAAIAMVYDHRKVETTLKDQAITKHISDKISLSPSLKNTHVEVTCFNQMVLLTGETPTAEQRQEAENIARNTTDVTKIYNEIGVNAPISSLTATNDSWITTKIKTQMLATKDLKSSTIKVVTENGAVYLMGIVTRAQANMAVDIARQVSGVKKVMKIFQYTSR